MTGGSVFRLCHAGGLHAPRDPKPLLRAMASLVRTMKPSDLLRLRLIGGTDPSLLAEAERLGISSCLEFVGRTDYLASIRLLGESDVVVVVEASCDEGIFLPSKFVDYAQTGRPILAISPRRGTLSDILDKAGGGVAVDCRDEEAILRGLHELYLAWKGGELEANYGSKRLLESFAPELVISQYLAMFVHLGVHRCPAAMPPTDNVING